MITRHLGLTFTRILILLISIYFIIIYPVADAGRTTASIPPPVHSSADNSPPRQPSGTRWSFTNE